MSLVGYCLWFWLASFSGISKISAVENVDALKALMVSRMKCFVVDVAQLVELRIVTPAVEGSIPFVHPNFKI